VTRKLGTLLQVGHFFFLVLDTLGHAHFPCGPRGSTISLTDAMILGDLIR
jgi:hypothetical protein